MTHPARLLCVLVATLLSAPLAQAQITCIAHPFDSTATWISSGSDTITWTNGTEPTADDADLVSTTCVWHTSNGAELVVNTTSIAFTGIDSTIDSLTTGEIFAALSDGAILDAVDDQMLVPSQVKSKPDTLAVLHDYCTTRTGSGTQTHFTPCSPQSWCRRRYAVYQYHDGQGILRTSMTLIDVTCPYDGSDLLLQ